MSGTILDDLFELNREMNRLFDEARYDVSGAWPETNVYEGKEDYVLVSKVPGTEKKDITVTVEDNTLTISGKRSKESDKDAKIHLSERFTGEFNRSFKLNDHVDVSAIKAETENGLLVIRVPKAPEAKPRRINIS